MTRRNAQGSPIPPRFLVIRRLWWRARGYSVLDIESLEVGLPRDFRLPYPYPRNEYEDGMNYVAVNSVMSARADW